MGFWDNINETISTGLYNNTSKTKTKNFDRYRAEIKKTREYIKSKREAFYKNSSLKER